MGVIIAKFARPKKRAQNILFSKNAVICHRDGVPYLMFRIVDTRKSHIVQALVRARLLRRKMTREGELINFYQQDLTLSAAEECDNYVLLMWPTIVIHKVRLTADSFVQRNCTITL
jgi:potassium inwardly-rectifying channel subfamily J